MSERAKEQFEQHPKYMAVTNCTNTYLLTTWLRQIINDFYDCISFGTRNSFGILELEFVGLSHSICESNK